MAVTTSSHSHSDHSAPDPIRYVSPEEARRGYKRRPSGEQARGLAGWLALSFAAAAIGTLVGAGGEWYASLAKPEWYPPNWVFGPAWPFLYITMAIAAWMVWRKGGWRVQTEALAAFCIQLALNALWTPLFFGLQAPGLALICLALLW